MKAISVLLYELTADEARYLPSGFPFLEYDSLYGSLRVMTGKKERVRDDKRYVYLLYKDPPVNFVGETGKQRSKLVGVK